jgi:hypothetical protein
MDRLQPGQAEEPLPPEEWVLRLAVASKDFLETGQVSPEVFAFSTEDRRKLAQLASSDARWIAGEPSATVEHP